MLGRPLVLAAVVLTLIAGCVTPASQLDSGAAPSASDLAGSTRLAPPDKDLSKVIVSDHGAPMLHALPELHGGAYRVDVVGYNSLTGVDAGPGALAQGSNFIAVTLFQDKYACVAGFVGTGGVGGFTILDIADPAKPKILSTTIEAFLISRCEFTPDGKFLLVGVYGSGLGAHDGVTPLGNLGDTGAKRGVSIYDVSDPKSPKFLTHDVTGATAENGDGAYHNFAMELKDGVVYVYQTYTGNVLELAADGKSMKLLTTIEHADHDFWVGPHAITGERLLVTGAAKGGGTAFYSIDDPASPVLLGTWETPEDDKDIQGWHRQFGLAQTVGGKAIMVVAGETCGSGKTLPYTVLDYTDMNDIKQLGSWQIPGKPEITGVPVHLCDMSAHEFTTWNGYVATGNYHAGMWVFDIGTPERLMEPVTIGYIEPNTMPQTSGGTRNTPFAWSPDVWGAYFDSRGYIHFADWSSGYYVVEVPDMIASATAG